MNQRVRIHYAQRPHYVHHLKILEQTKTRKENIQLQANWSNAGWAAEVLAIFELLEEDDVLLTLRLSASQQGLEEVSTDASTSAELFTGMLIKQASQRCWSMSMWSELPPLQWCGILDDEPAAARGAFEKLRTDADVVKAALLASPGDMLFC